MSMSLRLVHIEQQLQILLRPLPVLMLGMMILRFPDLLQAIQLSAPLGSTLQAMLINDGLAMLKGLSLWCVLSSPCLLLKRPQSQVLALGFMGTLLLLGEAALVHYFEVAGVPLGADLFAYTAQEILTTASGSNRPWPWSVLGSLFVALIFFWSFMAWCMRRFSVSMKRPWATVAFCLSLVSSPVLPTQLNSHDLASDYRQHRKLTFFIADVLGKSSETLIPYAGLSGSDRAFPFAHSETTPDTLGAHFNLKDDKPPHLIIVVVEGLGRSFSGPGALLGSFTPFIDSLAEKSLYWENFLATQGRTFAVLPSVLGSLPYAPYGERVLVHDSLLSILKSQSYSLRYFSGSNLAFDRQGDYLASEGVQSLVSEQDFVQGEKKASEWGYADADLFNKVGDNLRQTQPQPTLSIVQTMSMHTPFNFPSIEDYRRKVNERLLKLKISPEKQQEYLKHQDIYASILYTDDALRMFVEKLSKSPDWQNTILMITGDHRLPEIPMATRLERYHVPLVVHSPMLRAPQSIKSVSSHFDIAPSLLAMLSNRYNFKTPSMVSWMGTGLDMQVPYRNVHRLPLKQTKTELSDYVSGDYYLAQDRLYRLSDGLHPEPIQNADILAELKAEFGQFRASLSKLDLADRLVPANSTSEWKAFSSGKRTLEPNGPLRHFKGVEVTQAQALLTASGDLQITAQFQHQGASSSDVFVPLAVLTDPMGQELGEVSGKAIQLQAGQSQTVNLSIKLAPARLVNGRYFISVIVSHPETGQPIGLGQYHVAIQN
jgi:glucan phosphoethanolaminetransferase (alkaline phosphatase superfamily)